MSLSIRIIPAALSLLLLISLVPNVLSQRPDQNDQNRKLPGSIQSTEPNCEIGDPEVLQAYGIIIKPKWCSAPQLELEKIREDLAYLELFVPYASQVVAQTGELNYQDLEKVATEVRKRARRLETELVLPQTDPPTPHSQEIPIENMQLRPAVVLLATLIEEAVRNPVLKGQMIDLNLSTKAVQDLHRIVALAAFIQRSCNLEAPRN